MRNITKYFALLSIFCLNSGCAWLLNPFDSTSLPCPQTGYGKCVSVDDAYKEATEYRSPLITEPQPSDGKAKESPPQMTLRPQLSIAEQGYQDATYNKLTNMIKRPVTPVVAPPDVVRVLLLPYKSSGSEELFMPRYAFFMASGPKFVVGDYLVDMEER
jgi:conjugal transfer pilus assembly protein TraV